ncbi:hypothetical protein [Algivirga pacifica]
MKTVNLYQGMTGERRKEKGERKLFDVSPLSKTTSQRIQILSAQ